MGKMCSGVCISIVIYWHIINYVPSSGYWNAPISQKEAKLMLSFRNFFPSYVIYKTMRPEFFIFVATMGIIANVYSDGRFTSIISTFMHGKNLRMVGIAIAGMCVYNLYKSLSGERKFEFMQLTNEYLSNGPIDKIAPMLHPALDMTQYNKFKNAGSSECGNNLIVPIRTASMAVKKQQPTLELLQPIFDEGPHCNNENGMDIGFSKRSMARLQNSGMIGNGKRSVSAAKRKYIAACQNWRCKHCKIVLSSFFEIDHIERIADGGSNHVSNLAALCLHCHKYKTELQR